MPSTIGLSIFSSAAAPEFAAPTTIDRTKSHVRAPRVPVIVNDEATGRARRLTDSRPMTSPARSIA